MYLKYLNFPDMTKSIFRNKDIILQFFRRDILNQYQESFLGLLWVLINPLMTLCMYAFVFGIVFERRWTDDPSSSLLDFAVILFCGITVFNLFSEIVNASPNIVLSNPNYIKKVVFPLEVLNIVQVLVSLFHMLVRMALVILANLLINQTIPWTIILLPIMILPLVMICLGISWFLSSISVFFRDIQQGIGVVTQALFFFSAILYPLESVPMPYRMVLSSNPLTWVIDSARQVVLWGSIPDISTLVVWFVIGFVLMILGYAWFMFTKPLFADVV